MESDESEIFDAFVRCDEGPKQTYPSSVSPRKTFAVQVNR